MKTRRMYHVSRWTWLGLGLISLVASVALAQPDLAGGRATSAAGPATTQPAVDADADFNEPVTGTNVTATYKARYEQDMQTLFSAKRRALLRGYRIILVPGFVTGFYMQISQIAKDTFQKDSFLDYLNEQNEAVNELGLDAANELLDKKQFNTQAAVAVNAQRIIRAVKEAAAAGKKVILISHSKGGNDTLAALLLLQRKGGLKPVRGWLSIQSGFYGSPVADAAMNSPTMRATAKLFLEQAGGSLDSLRDSTGPACEKFMADNAKNIGRLVKTLPILSFTSWKPKPREEQRLRPDTILFIARNFMEEKGLKNDGLVPRKSAVLPGTQYVAKAGIDHAETAMKNPPPVVPSQLDRKQLTWALLSMLLDRIEPQSARGAADPHGAAVSE